MYERILSFSIVRWLFNFIQRYVDTIPNVTKFIIS